MKLINTSKFRTKKGLVKGMTKIFQKPNKTDQYKDLDLGATLVLI